MGALPALAGPWWTPMFVRKVKSVRERDNKVANTNTSIQSILFLGLPLHDWCMNSWQTTEANTQTHYLRHIRESTA